MNIERLQVLTQDHPSLSHAELAERACAAGVKWIQFRDKSDDEGKVVDRLNQVKEVCDKYNCILIVNDRVELARKIKADGVHLGKNDMSIPDARRYLGSQFIIGGTANTMNDVIAINQMPADYIGLGPFKFTTTKKNLSPVISTLEFSRIVECSSLPIIGIGGIMEEDLSSLRNTGVYGIAVASGFNFHNEPVEFVDTVNSIFNN